MGMGPSVQVSVYHGNTCDKNGTYSNGVVVDHVGVRRVARGRGDSKVGAANWADLGITIGESLVEAIVTSAEAGTNGGQCTLRCPFAAWSGEAAAAG